MVNLNNKWDSVVEPCFIIKVNGKKLSPWLYNMITKVVFKEVKGDGANESLEIYFDDPEFQVVNKNIFIEKKTKVSCKIGYTDNNDQIFSGMVQEIENNYPQSGNITLKVVARDNGYIMSDGEKTKTWKGKTYSDIAASIFKAYGMKPVVDDTSSIKPRSTKGGPTIINQSGVSDLKMLKNMASKCHYRLNIDSSKNKGYFVKKDKTIKAKTIISVDYKCGNQKLMAFRPKFNDYKKAMKAKASNINIKQNKVISNNAKK